MGQAKDALERGDFAEARRLAQQDPSSPEAKEIFERTAPDRVIVYLSAACVLFFLAVIYLTIWHK